MEIPSTMMKLLALCLFAVSVQSEDVLMLLPFSSKSHKNVFDPLAKALGTRGHQVTILSSFVPAKQSPNVTELAILEVLPEFENTKKLITKMTGDGVTIALIQEYVEIHKRMCLILFQKGYLQDWLKEGKQFDLVVLDGVMSECVVGFGEKLGKAVLVMNTATLFPWVGDAIGCPSPYSYVPNNMFPYTPRMTFLQRLYNVFMSEFYMLTEKWLTEPSLDALVQSHFPGVRSIHNALRNVSFVLVNADPVFNVPRPGVPNLAEVGGLHCRPAQPLPKDLLEFVESSGEDGFVVFSLGSIHDGSLMKPERKRLLLNAFKRLKQKVIWKYEADVEEVPSNVKIVKWLPQQDLLGHPKIKAFITHSGLLSLQEAIYHSVPLVGVPIFADQPGNMALAAELGVAVGLDWQTLTEEDLFNAITKAVTDEKMKSNVNHYSKIFKDRARPPLETAVFWTEYVLRHKGALHFRSPALDLNFFQYYLLDVAAVAALAIFGVLLIFKFLFCGGRKEAQSYVKDRLKKSS